MDPYEKIELLETIKNNIETQTIPPQLAEMAGNFAVAYENTKKLHAIFAFPDMSATLEAITLGEMVEQALKQAKADYRRTLN